MVNWEAQLLVYLHYCVQGHCDHCDVISWCIITTVSRLTVMSSSSVSSLLCPGSLCCFWSFGDSQPSSSHPCVTSLSRAERTNPWVGKHFYPLRFILNSTSITNDPSWYNYPCFVNAFKNALQMNCGTVLWSRSISADISTGGVNV